MSLIKLSRKKMEMSQKDVALLAGISRQYYNKIERGKRKPSVKLAKVISEILEIEWTIFFNKVNK